MNTIILQRILMHMMDFEHNTIYYADDFLDLTPTMQEYYDKKVEKAWTSNKKTEVTVGDFASIIVRCIDMLEDTDKYFKHAHTITEELFELGRKIELMPNCNILFIECMIDGKKHMAILKLNYKLIPVSVVEEEDGRQVVRITNRQMVPSKGAPVEEAIIVNTEDRRVYLVERRFEIDGKLDYYLNKQYIKGEPLLTDKQKVTLLNKTIQKVENAYNVNEFEPKALVKQEMMNCMLDHKEMKPVEIASTILQKDYNAVEEAVDILNDLGIGESSEISSNYESVERLAKCKIVTDTDVEISVNVEDYLQENNIKKVRNEDGTYQIVLDNIKEMSVKQSSILIYNNEGRL